MNIKCRASGLTPSAVVLVATVRALKMHGGGPAVTAGRPLAPAYTSEDVALTRAGCANLARHVANAAAYGLPVLVAINRFATDTDAELEAVREEALAAGARAAVVCRHHALGGEGAVDLAQAVVEACAAPRPEFRFLYPPEMPIEVGRVCLGGVDGGDFFKSVATCISRAVSSAACCIGRAREQDKWRATSLTLSSEDACVPAHGRVIPPIPVPPPAQEKIRTIAVKTYGAASVSFTPEALASIARFTEQGFGNLPVCMAKTQYSFRWGRERTKRGGGKEGIQQMCAGAWRLVQ